MMSFKALYDREPPSIPDYVSVTASINPLDSLLLQRQEILHQLKTNLHKSQIKMKKTNQETPK